MNKTLLNLDPLSEVTQLNNYSYHEAKNKTSSYFIHISLEHFVLKAAELPRKTRAMRKGEAVDSKTREWKCINNNYYNSVQRKKYKCLVHKHYKISSSGKTSLLLFPEFPMHSKKNALHFSHIAT